MIEHRIVADDGQILRLRLSNQHAIERIFVGSRKKAGAYSMSSRYSECSEPIFGKRAFKIANQIYRR